MARDVMLFCQQRDPAKLPTAYPPVRSAEAAPLKQQADASPVVVQQGAQRLAKAGD
jgi:hypothetical protein